MSSQIARCWKFVSTRQIPWQTPGRFRVYPELPFEG